MQSVIVSFVIPWYACDALKRCAGVYVTPLEVFFGAKTSTRWPDGAIVIEPLADVFAPPPPCADTFVLPGAVLLAVTEVSPDDVDVCPSGADVASASTCSFVALFGDVR